MLVAVNTVSLSDEPLDATTFPHAWYTAQCLFEDIGDPDKSAMHVSQLQAFCYDPDLFFKPDARPLDGVLMRRHSVSFRRRLKRKTAFDALPADYREAIVQMEWNPDSWSRASVPCPWGEHELTVGDPDVTPPVFAKMVKTIIPSIA